MKPWHLSILTSLLFRPSRYWLSSDLASFFAPYNILCHVDISCCRNLYTSASNWYKGRDFFLQGSIGSTPPYWVVHIMKQDMKHSIYQTLFRLDWFHAKNICIKLNREYIDLPVRVCDCIAVWRWNDEYQRWKSCFGTRRGSHLQRLHWRPKHQRELHKQFNIKRGCIFEYLWVRVIRIENKSMRREQT